MKSRCSWRFSVLAATALVTLAACSNVDDAAALARNAADEGCPGAAYYTAFGTPAWSLQDIQAMASARLRVLGLEPAWEAPEGEAFQDTPEDREELRGLLSVVLPAFERYPRALLSHVRLRKLVFVKNLCVAGNFRMAMPAVERDSVVYGGNGDLLKRCQAGIEARVHHEFYHFIEARLFGDYYYRDPKWLALNPPGLNYGGGGITAYGPSGPNGTCVAAPARSGSAYANHPHPQPGAISTYALTGPEEDKAEVFGWMMTPGYASRLKAWAATDPALDAKREFMKRLATEISDGSMNASVIEWLAAQQHP